MKSTTIWMTQCQRKNKKCSSVKFQTEQLYKTSDTICESCVVSKQIQIIHHDIMWSITQKLEQVHADLWKYMIHHSSKTVCTSQYWLTITHRSHEYCFKDKESVL
jgi:hypothetical protein